MAFCDEDALFSVFIITKVFHNCFRNFFRFRANFSGSDNDSSRFSGSSFRRLIPMGDASSLVFSSKVIVLSLRLHSLLFALYSFAIDTGTLLNVSKLFS